MFTETVLDAAGNASATTLTTDVARAPIPASVTLPFALAAAHVDPLATYLAHGGSGRAG